MAELAPGGPVYQAGTLSGNPLATAAGLAVLGEVGPADYEALAARVAVFAKELESAVAAQRAGGGGRRRWVRWSGCSWRRRSGADRPADRLRGRTSAGRQRHLRAVLPRHAPARRGARPGPYEVLFPGLAHDEASWPGWSRRRARRRSRSPRRWLSVVTLGEAGGREPMAAETSPPCAGARVSDVRGRRGRDAARRAGLRRRWADGYLGRHPVRPGYAYVIWKGRHVAEPSELSAEEAAGFWSEVARVAAAVEDRYRPAKMNWLRLGNGVPHLHVHLVPRPHDDARPAGRSRRRPLTSRRRRRSPPAQPEAARRRAALARLPRVEHQCAWNCWPRVAPPRSSPTARGECSSSTGPTGTGCRPSRGPCSNGLAEAGLPVARAHGAVTVDGRSGIVARPGRGAVAARGARRRRAPTRSTASPSASSALQLRCNADRRSTTCPTWCRACGARSRRACPTSDAAQAELLALLAELDDGGHGVCHYDFHPLNVLVGAGRLGRHRLAHRGGGPPAADLARTLVLVGAAVGRAVGQLLARRPPERAGRPGPATTTTVDAWVRVVAAARLAEGFDGEEAAWLPVRVADAVPRVRAPVSPRARAAQAHRARTWRQAAGSRPLGVGQEARHQLHGPVADLGRAGGVGPHQVGHDAQQLVHQQLRAHAEADAEAHGLGVRDQVHERPGHLVIRAVGGGQLAVVLGQGRVARRRSWRGRARRRPAGRSRSRRRCPRR